MTKKCNSCGSDKLTSNVPYVVHESAMARAERQNKRLVWVIVLLIVLLVGSNIGWLVYESQLEVVETTEEIVIEGISQESDNGNNNIVGGDFINGTTNN